MKYILLTPVCLLFMLLVIISITIGGLNFLWDFKKTSYYKGVRWLDKKINFFDYLTQVLG